MPRQNIQLVQSKIKAEIGSNRKRFVQKNNIKKYQKETSIPKTTK